MINGHWESVNSKCRTIPGDQAVMNFVQVNVELRHSPFVYGRGIICQGGGDQKCRYHSFGSIPTESEQSRDNTQVDERPGLVSAVEADRIHCLRLEIGAHKGLVSGWPATSTLKHSLTGPQSVPQITQFV